MTPFSPYLEKHLIICTLSSNEGCICVLEDKGDHQSIIIIKMKALVLLNWLLVNSIIDEDSQYCLQRILCRLYSYSYMLYVFF